MFLQGPIAPGEIISIFGAGLGPADGVGLQLDSEGRVATVAGGTQVLIGGVAAPILYAQANQVNAVVPYEIANTTSTALQVAIRDSLRRRSRSLLRRQLRRFSPWTPRGRVRAPY